MSDNVNHPGHYTQYDREVIELTERMGFCEGNAAKYVLRAPFKGHQLEDLEKALWYVKRLKKDYDKSFSEVSEYFSEVSPIVKALLDEDYYEAETLLTQAIHKLKEKERDNEIEQLRKAVEAMSEELMRYKHADTTSYDPYNLLNTIQRTWM